MFFKLLILIAGFLLFREGGNWDRPAAPAPLPEVAISELPGTEHDNAGKAIRSLFESIEQREGQIGFDLSYEMKGNAERFFGDIPEIVRVVSIQGCDWGIEPDWSATLPQSPAVNGFHTVLLHHARSEAEAERPEAAAKSLTASVRLARHGSSGRSVLEKHMALKQIRESAAATAELLSAGLLNRQAAQSAVTEFAWLHGNDPLDIGAAIRIEGRMFTEALNDGRISRESFASLEGDSWRGPDFLEARRIAPFVQPAYDRIADAWGQPNFLDVFQQVQREFGRQSGKHVWLLTNFERIHERWEEAVAAVAKLEAELAEPDPPTPENSVVHP